MPNRSDKRITIHLIEDDASQRDSIESLLNFKGYITKSYSKAKDFLKTAHFERPAIVISDIRLPDMSGVELHQALIEKDINDMVLAGHDVQNVVESCTYSGLTATLKYKEWTKV